ncbi:hypothetical protein Hanom_Chr12g01168491 [Helianthus anomalus]
MKDLNKALCDVINSIPETNRVSSHRVFCQRVLLLWWHNDYQVTADGIVSSKKRPKKPNFETNVTLTRVGNTNLFDLKSKVHLSQLATVSC